MSEQETGTLYKVVLNHEEQYSLWPAERDNAPGWRDAGKQGTREQCLEYIQQVWVDMRPLSLRQQLNGQPR
jgi:MbtH protein